MTESSTPRGPVVRRGAARAALVAVAATGGLTGLLAAAPAAFAAAAITTVSPVGQGAVDFPVTVTGSGFGTDRTAVVVTFSKPTLSTGTTGVAVDATTFTGGVESVTDTAVRVHVKVPAAEPTSNGGIIVSVKVGIAAAVACGNGLTTGCLTVDAAPSAVTVQDVGAGASSYARNVTANGLKAGTARLLLTSASDVTVPPFTVTASGTQSALISVTPTASPRTVSATFVNGDGGRAATTIKVTPAPVLSGPARALVGLPFSATFGATGLQAGATVSTLGLSAKVTSAGTTTGQLSFGTVPSRPAGSAAVAVTNPDGGRSSSNLVTVVAPPAPPTSVAVQSVGDGSAVITWTAPTGDGVSPVTSYQVTTTPDTGGIRTVSADQPLTYTLVGLANGGNYTASVQSVNADALVSGPATTGSFSPGAGGTGTGGGGTTTPTPLPTSPQLPVVVTPKVVVTAIASATQVELAKKLSFHGLVTSDGKASPGTRVSLDQLGTGGRLEEIASAVTDGRGGWSVPGFTPTVNKTYVATVAGVRSRTVAVKVGQLLRLGQAGLSGRTLTIKGYATPATTAKNVKVVLFLVDKKGHRLKSVAAYSLGKKVKVAGYSLGANEVTVKRTLAKGTYRLVVAVYDTPTNAGASSPVYTVTVS